MKSQRTTLVILSIALVVATIFVHHLWGLRGNERLSSEDIFYVWEEGKRLAAGVNPYARIIGESLRDNNKYPTYLPLSYFFVAILHRLGIKDFVDFVSVWRPISLACHLGITAVTFSIYSRRGKPLSGLIACSILLLGRWSAYIINVQHSEFAAILPILLAGQQLNRRPKLSALLFGLSLCVKHVGIILLPSFLLGLQWEPLSSRPSKRTNLLVYAGLALALPLIISIPFLINQPSGFLLNIIFSTTRGFGDHGSATGTRLILTGVDGTRLLMVSLIAMNWIAQAKENINFWFASTITLLIFLQFNAVIFAQYYIWLISFLLISCAFLTPSRIKAAPTE